MNFDSKGFLFFLKFLALFILVIFIAGYFPAVFFDNGFVRNDDDKNGSGKTTSSRNQEEKYQTNLIDPAVLADTLNKTLSASGIEIKGLVYDEPENLEPALPLKFARLKPPEVSAKSFLVADIASGTVFLEKNSQTKRSLASLTKLMTAVVASEAIFSERTVRLNNEMIRTYGDSGNLRAGEIFSLSDLLYPLLLSSSNDAAQAISTMAYSEKDFIGLMNVKAKALDMKDTFFKEAEGLEPGNMSTADDLFRLAKYLLDKRLFLLKITAEPFHEIVRENSGFRRIFYNINEFAGDKEFIGGKTGYTSEAGGTMVGIFNPVLGGETRDTAIIILGSDDREGDIQKLLAWVKKAFSERDKHIQLAFVGDIMFDRGVEKTVAANGGGDFKYPFKLIDSFLRNYDFLFGNLEGSVSDKGNDQGSLYSFRMMPKAIEGLKDAGFDAVSVANNHIGDWGREAMQDTFERLKNSEILAVGGGMNNEEAYEPRIITIKDAKIALLAFSQFGKDYLEAKENEPGIAIADEEKIKHSVQRAKEKADIVVVSYHFGDEYQRQPNAEQKKLSRFAIDIGANLVVGHHPHVVQPIEKYKGGYIAYSLGNFVFDQNFSKETMEGALLEVDVSAKKIITVSPRKIYINEKFQPAF